MSYLVFARKWRPQNFDEVIGQEHIATTLKNAISLGHVGHAYLFAGPRGTGKTSTARILAKALNCQKGPVPSPCNHCQSCQEISEGRSLDVIEIDGASNRGIEQIRQLRENVKFAPAKDRFKIYIIDEVHQITTDGFNALLKTLEEPPAHVKFIFATTQAHKVLPTIISRCQRFNFKPLATSGVIEKLKHIVQKEKLDVSEEALLYIARSAAGSMRDAESILDQLSSFCAGQIKLETVTAVLGLVDLESQEEIARQIIARNSAEAISLTEKVINEGKDPVQFIGGLMEHFRNILITKVMSKKHTPELIDLPAEHIERISEQGKSLSFEELFYIFNVLLRTQESLRRCASARVIVEMAVVRLTQRENLVSLEKILARLTILEQDLQNSNVSLNPTTKEKKSPLRDALAPETQETVSLETFGTMEDLKQASPPGQSNIGEVNPQPVQAQNDSGTTEQLPPVNTEGPPLAAGSNEQLDFSWSDFLQAIQEEKMFVASALEFGRMSSLENGVLTITFPKNYNFYKETLEDPENKKFIELKANELFRRQIRIKFVLAKDDPVEPSEEKMASFEGPANKASDEAIIKSALNIFKGRVIKRSAK